MAVLADTTVLLGKELRTEFRSRELLTTTVVFILVVVVLFSFTFDPSAGESRRFGPGLLWLSFLFAASLMLPPVLTASTEATRALLDANPVLRADWLGFLAGFDVVFLTALWLFGEYLLEE